MLAALLCAGVATFAQLYSVQGVLPLIQADLGVTPAQSALTLSAATFGIAVSVVGWAAVSDRVGRKRAMVAAILVATLLALASAMAPTFPLLVLIRFVEGCALGGIPAVAMAYIAEEVHPAHSALAAASFISGNSLGGLSGRIVAAPVAEVLGWRGGVLVVALVAVVAMVLFVLLAPAQRGFRPRPLRLGEIASRVLEAVRDRRLLVLYLQAFLLMGSFVAMYNYLGFHLGEPPFSISPGWVSLLFLAYLSGTWSSAAAGRLALRWGRRRVLLVSGASMILALVVVAVPWLPAIVAGLVLYTAGFFAAHSIANGWVPALAHRVPAQASSLYILGYYTGSSVVGYFGGVVYSATSWLAFCAFLGLLVLAAITTARLVLPRTG
ncbi:Predicted arabinose efflux permease, MFS family [Tessaracoccus oleiagri]|uniref:Predicted arabinose efflux permease, MFS family n=2 Tax=Tessaracoccus oleiagri TaxID=686624 RepID=A0A1G9J5W4_9ACTN|nr:Predicted arabinose efflux permease, MFS family [Tessaracoccus oleiagri]